MMVPLPAPITRPAGRPVAHQVMVALEVSLAKMVRAVMALPDWLDWAPGLVTAMELVMVQVKLAEALKPALSVAVMVTLEVPAVVGVPVMAPVAGSIDRPAGRPVADQVMVAVDEVSMRLMARGVIGEPVALDWVPGLMTETVLSMVQVNVADPMVPALSVAVRTTVKTPAVVGVPVIVPVPVLALDRQAGLWLSTT